MMSKDQKNVCAYCTHWSIKDKSTPEDYVHTAVGQCRLRSPKIMAFGSEADGVSAKTVWPLTVGGDWCGEFRERLRGYRRKGSLLWSSEGEVGLGSGLGASVRCRWSCCDILPSNLS